MIDRKPLKILMLSEPYPPRHPGGAGKLARTIAKGLARHSHQVHVVCVDRCEDAVVFDEGVRIQRVRTRDEGWTERTLVERSERLLPVLLSLHDRNQYDLVHDAGGFLYADVFRKFVHRSGVPGITHLLLLMAPYLTEARVPIHFIRLFHELQVIQCLVSRAVITTSRSEQMYYKKLFGPAVPADIIIPNCIERPALGDDEIAKSSAAFGAKRGLVGFIGGRLNDRVKGTDRACAFGAALERMNVKIHMVGTDLSDGDVPSDIREMITSVGRLTDEALTELLRAVDFVLCPSRYEAFGLLAVEAGAVGTPVLASAIGGHLDTVDVGWKGILVTDDEWENPTDRIVHYVRNIRCKIRPRLPARFTDTETVCRIEALYYDLLRGEK